MSEASSRLGAASPAPEHRHAAERLGVRIGDSVSLAPPGGRGVRPTLEVVGLWRAHDPAATVWHGDPSVASGESDGAIDPAVVVAACSLAPLAAGTLASLAERMLRGSRGISPVLPLRQLARRMRRVAVPILCLTPAAATGAFTVMTPAAADSVDHGRQGRRMVRRDARRAALERERAATLAESRPSLPEELR